MEEVEGNELKIECDFVFGGAYNFTDVAIIDLSSISDRADTAEVNRYSTIGNSNIQITNEIIGDIEL